MWQEQGDSNDTGRHLFCVQRNVGGRRSRDGSRREEAVLTRLRIGHSGLNKSLFIIGKHHTGACEFCSQPETAEHVLIECSNYKEERNCLTSIHHKEGKTLTLVNILGNTSKSIKNQVIKFLKNTGLFYRI